MPPAFVQVAVPDILFQAFELLPSLLIFEPLGGDMGLPAASGCHGSITAAGRIRLGEEAVDTGLKLWAGHHVVLDRRQLRGQLVHPPRHAPASGSRASSAR